MIAHSLYDGAADLAAAAATLAAGLPGPLRPLARLAYDYRWSWAPGGAELYAAIHPRRWEVCGHNPVRLLQEVRMAQQTLSDIVAHGMPTEVAPTGATDVAAFLQSLSSAWKDGEARPTHRKQPKAKHWWRTRADPFADAWPVIEGWLIAEPSIAAKALMERLVVMVPEMYGSKAQLRTLQRRVKAWRSARVTAMVLGGLRKSATEPIEV